MSSTDGSAARQGTELWESCYYPWNGNGWIKCVCGQWFHSKPTATATAQHADHVKEAHSG